MSAAPAVLALAVAAVALAGCSHGATDDPGAGAYDLVRTIVLEAGEPQPRVPGTEGHAEALRELRTAMDVPGWTLAEQAFSGEQYLALDHGAVSAYVDGEGSCTAAERSRVAQLRFTNLVATWDGPYGSAGSGGAAGSGGSGEPTPAPARWWLGAHWDSKRFANQDPDPARRQWPVVGANDGASGVGVALQFMREVARGAIAPVAPVGVVLFDGEDGFEDCHPLAGSLWFVHRHRAEGMSVGRLLLLDMVGDPDARFVRESTSATCAQEWMDLAWAKAPGHGLGENFIARERPVTDDHVPFVEAGIPALDIIDFGRSAGEGISGFPPYWHTTGDTLDKVDAAMLGRMLGLVGDIFDEPSDVGCPP